MTEEEAKTKWCPHANCDDENEKCIGSECMAWRWNDKDMFGSKDLNEGQGFCGLAGKP